jgi:hypothetical protein
LKQQRPILFIIIIPVALAILLLYYYKEGKRQAAEIGLGVGTIAYAPVAGNYPIHIMNLQQTDALANGYRQRGQKDVFLWLGNSQLHGVNQYKSGKSNCIEFIFNKIKEYGKEVLGVSYPNANCRSSWYQLSSCPKKLISMASSSQYFMMICEKPVSGMK